VISSRSEYLSLSGYFINNAPTANFPTFFPLFDLIGGSFVAWTPSRDIIISALSYSAADPNVDLAAPKASFFLLSAGYLGNPYQYTSGSNQNILAMGTFASTAIAGVNTAYSALLAAADQISWPISSGRSIYPYLAVAATPAIRVSVVVTFEYSYVL